MDQLQTAISIVIGICWMTFLLYWLVSARNTKRTVWRQNIWKTSLPIILIALCGALLANKIKANGILWPYNPAIGIACAIVAILSLGLLIWARNTLGRNWSGQVVLKENHELVTSGPYSVLRHPIYAGVMFLALATAVDYARVTGFFVFSIMLITFIMRTYLEDKLMAQTFPDTYPEYKERTWKLIPRVW